MAREVKRLRCPSCGGATLFVDGLGGLTCSSLACKHPVVEEIIAVPIPMLLTCPSCGKRHVDEGEYATKEHHTHACQHCGTVWRPAIVATVGVQFLPGFKN